MKVLVVGSGGREHALCWKLFQDGHTVFARPGSAAMKSVATPLGGDIGDLEGTARAAAEIGVDLVVVGPEAPLVDGLADTLRDRGIPVFGPGAEGARLEGSKAFSKQFFRRNDIPTAEFFVCKNMSEVEEAVASLGARVVVKADGLAAGKGVVVCTTREEARAAARSMLEDGRFGAAGRDVVVERRLEGRELSVMALCDGKRFVLLAPAEDHKAIGDGDRGANTGGMGTISPATWATPELLQTVKNRIFVPTMNGLAREGIDLRGVLYAGLMVDGDGQPWLLEYNVRFGDPETQVVLMRMQADLGRWLHGAACGELPEGEIPWDDKAAACVVLAAHGYPGAARSGDIIRGPVSVAPSAKVQVFHAGTREVDGQYQTAGGRVLGVTATGQTPDEARLAAYAAVDTISFDGMQFRTDIGRRGE